MNLKSIFIFFIASYLTLMNLLHAEVSTDGTVGPSQSLAGPDYAIPETLGTIKGNNLFHSFQRFNIKTEESATFTGPDSIQNVISRVTGGERSDIDGTLRSNIGNADFYFINPSGIVFGPNATIDVPAAFHVSTTGELKFADGSSFKALKSEQSTLTQAAPESFGFLGTQSATIEVNGADIEIKGSTLSFVPESKVSLTSSKDITIKETTTGTETKQASLTSEGGEIAIKASGDLLLDNATVESSGNGGGKIDATASSVKLHNNSKIAADNTGDKSINGNAITVKADEAIEIKQGSRIQSNVVGSGDSGTIKVEAKNMLIRQEGEEGVTGILIEVEKDATGNGQTVDVSVKENLNIQGVAGIASSTSGVGDSASVNVSAGLLQMDGEGRSIPYRDTYYTAGIASNGLEESSGDTNEVSVYVDTLLEMVNGCGISAYSYGTGDGSNVNIKAGEMRVDGSGTSEYLTIIATSSGSEGKSVKTNIEVEGLFELLNGAQIFSDTSLQNDAGAVSITAGSLRIDNKGLENKYTGIWSDTYFGSGNAGNIDINVAGLIEILDGGKISSSTWSDGNAGEISIRAGELTIDDYGKSQYATGYALSTTGVWNDAYAGSKGNAGKIELSVSGQIELLNGGQIASNTWSEGKAGKVLINAGEMKLENQYSGVLSSCNYGSQGDAGEIDINVDGTLELLNGGRIASETYSEGDAGEIDINVDGTLELLNGGQISSATHSQGDAGTVKIKVSGLLDISNGAFISSETRSQGDGNRVSVNANTLKIQGQPNCFTGIWSDADPDSQGNAGTVEVTVNNLLELLNGGQISSTTWSTGEAGNVNIITENLMINAQENKEHTTGIFSETLSDGNAGKVKLTVNSKAEILHGGQISSTTYGQGYAGDVDIFAKNILIDDQDNNDLFYTGIVSNSWFGGVAGTVNVTVDSMLEILNGGQISSETWSTGNGGNVIINTANLRIDDQGTSEQYTGIWSDSMKYGNAGTVDVTVSGLLELLNEGQISSDTYGEGNAGKVIVNANDIIMENEGYIGSAAYVDSKGYVGDIKINANSIQMKNNSCFSIFGLQNLSADKLFYIKEQQSLISINSKECLLDNSFIISSSTQNVPASPINITAEKLFVSNDSRILSTANLADGGDVNVKGRTIFLNDGLIMTSVFEENGNGGDITINGLYDNEKADFLVMKNGFIKANTEGTDASGGEIGINVKGVIADLTQELKIGGKEIILFEPGINMNVIQSAAPDGYPGEINISGVELDFNGSIMGASTKFSNQIQLATDPCESIGTEKASSLVQKPRIYFSEMPSAPSSVFYGGSRLDELLSYMEEN